MYDNWSISVTTLNKKNSCDDSVLISLKRATKERSVYHVFLYKSCEISKGFKVN